MFGLKKNNSRGSAIVQAMVATALLTIVALGAMSLSTNFSRTQKITDLRDQANAAARLIGTVGSTNALCKTSLVTLPNIDSFNGAAAQSADVAGGQRLKVCLPSLTTDGVCDIGNVDEWFPKDLATPNRIPGTQLFVKEVIFSNSEAPLPAGLFTQYKGKLSVILDSPDPVGASMAARDAVLDLSILVSGANQIDGCSAAQSAEQICKSMGCIYNSGAILPELPCTCGLPDAACAAGEVMIGMNADGTLNCVPSNETCPPGEVVKGITYNNSGVALTCAPVGAWDYSAFTCAPGGVATREVRCVNAAAMDKYMRDNGFNSFRATASLPPNIVIDEGYCDPFKKPATSGACSINCSLAAGSAWSVGADICVADTTVTIDDGATEIATDSIGPAMGTASYTCTAGIITENAGSTCSQGLVVPICGTDDGQALAATPVNLCDAGTPSEIFGAGPWTWTCNGLGTVNCSATLAVAPPAVGVKWIKKTLSCAAPFPTNGLMTTNRKDGKGGSVGSDNDKVKFKLCTNFEVQWNRNNPNPAAVPPWIDSGLRDDSSSDHDLSEDSNNGPLTSWWIRGAAIGTSRWIKTFNAGCPAGWVDTHIWDDDFGRRDLCEGGATKRRDNLCIYPMPAACDAVMLCPGGTFKVLNRAIAARNCAGQTAAAMDAYCNTHARGGVNDYNFFGAGNDDAGKPIGNTEGAYYGSCFSGTAKSVGACTIGPDKSSAFTCECL